MTTTRIGYRSGGWVLPAAFIIAAGMLLLTLGATRTSAASVTPIFVAGNPSCADLGYDFGFKVDPPNSGTYAVFSGNSITVVADGTYFDWTSTFGIDAVIVKGGPNSNAYVYDPPAESFGDTGLHSPINPSTGQPFGLSHIEFCYDFDLVVTKTANTTFTRTFSWEIDKSVTPAAWELFTGDSGTSQYTVAVTKTVVDSDWAVNGTISINNPAPVAATVTSVTDTVSGGIAATVVCPSATPFAVPAGGTVQCTYSASLPNANNRVNTATVTTSGPVGGDSGTADVTFGAPTTVVGYETINVSDTFAGDLGSFSASGSATYSRTFTCDGDEGTHDNTATIDETGQSDSASVDVDCYALQVTKDADESFDRTWEWTIDKSADQTSLTLTEGQLFEVNYQVMVSATASNHDHAVSGTIWVYNPAPMGAELTGVSDVISPAIAATVDCGVTFPYVLASGGTLECTYSADLPDGADRTNTATATLQNYAYDSTGAGTKSGTTNFTGTAMVSFTGVTPSTETDECIDVSDTNVGFLGTVCASAAPATFNYALWFGAHPDADVILECGDNTHTNVASFVTNDTGTTGEDSWTVTATVACEFGCTLTPGYWKTHSEFGPAPYDDTWAELANGASTTFFLSGQTYYQVLWTAPGGNAYYQLAFHYIAAELNILNGASAPADVQTAMASAKTLFETYTPAQIGALKGNSSLRAQFVSLAGTLGSYNEGLIGPGHCSE